MEQAGAGDVSGMCDEETLPELRVQQPCYSVDTCASQQVGALINVGSLQTFDRFFMTSNAGAEVARGQLKRMLAVSPVLARTRLFLCAGFTQPTLQRVQQPTLHACTANRRHGAEPLFAISF